MASRGVPRRRARRSSSVLARRRRSVVTLQCDQVLVWKEPAKCDGGGFVVDDKTGNFFTGSGRTSSLCGKGAPALATGITIVILSEVKTAISLPDAVFRAVDAQAKRLKVSRSEFFARAAVRLLATLEDERVRASYDEGFADEDSPQSSFTRRAARRALLAIEWKDK